MNSEETRESWYKTCKNYMSGLEETDKKKQNVTKRKLSVEPESQKVIHLCLTLVYAVRNTYSEKSS